MNRRVVLRVFVLAVAALAAAGPAHATTRSASATATVTIAAVAKLSLSSTTLVFPDANPDTVPRIPSSGGAIGITAKTRTTRGSTANLSVLAADDLRAGTSTIPVGNVTWTATGDGFVAGTMNRSVAQTVATWVSSGAHVGSQSYFLANRWEYATGSYSTTFVFTLSAP